MRFEVRLNGEPIGFSELEGGDAPMGVAFGRFIPNPAYRSVQPHCIEKGINGVTIPALTVHTNVGASIECSGGVQIIDLSPKMGDAGIQIHINGVPYPLYAELFPHHVKAYRDQFPDHR